jgi:hypothetical protein
LNDLIEKNSIKPQLGKIAKDLETIRDAQGWQRKQAEASFIPVGIANNNPEYGRAVLTAYEEAAKTLMTLFGSNDYGDMNHQLTKVGLGIEDVLSVDLANEKSMEKERIYSREGLKQAWLRRKLALIHVATALSRGTPEELKKYAKHPLGDVGSYQSMIDSIRGDYGQILSQCGNENVQKAIVLYLIQTAPVGEVATKLNLNLAEMNDTSLDDDDWMKYKSKYAKMLL